MQLVAYGAQDIYLTGNPQITFFKVVYRRHTNFAMESIEQTFNGTADFGRKVQCLISRNGDLISRVYLQVQVPRVSGHSASFRWVDDLGHHLIKEMNVEIGGQEIDRQFGQWLQIWNDLTIPAGQRRGYQIMVGGPEGLNREQGQFPGSLQQWSAHSKPARTLYVPLRFWFNHHIGLALPLIALQYHEVKINMEFRPAGDLVITSESSLSKSLQLDAASLWVDYIYLDTDERRRFAQVSHEYLIEQLQFTGEESLTSSASKIRLNFNHPVKELIWVVQHDAQIATGEDDFEGVIANNQLSNFTDVLGSLIYDHSNPLFSANPVKLAKLQLNGHDRFAAREGSYFNLVQPYQHHTNIPLSPGVNVYSFALKPEEHQPSGSCNFSRIDNATLQLTVAYANSLVDKCSVDTDGLVGILADQIEPFVGCALRGINAKLYIYAINLNVLRIMSGMGGLAYSN